MTVVSSHSEMLSDANFKTKEPHRSSTPNNILPDILAPIEVAMAAGAAALSFNTSIDFVPTTMSVTDVLLTVIQNHQKRSTLHHFPIFAIDLSTVYRQLLVFRTVFPRITPYYAIKCNPDPVLINFLARLGVSFDCASREEVNLATEALGIPENNATLNERIIFANPVKESKDLVYLKKIGAALMTFDSIDELKKIANSFRNAQVLLRIAVKDSAALCPLSTKFGAQMEEVDSILDEIERLGLDLAGVAFHVGSGCTSLDSYKEALFASKNVFDSAAKRGRKLRILDIGGGFPGHDKEAPITFNQIANAVSPLVESLFDHDVRVIAEPGRYLVTTAFTMASQVVMATRRENHADYYMSDGVFGSFRDARLLNVRYPAEILWRQNFADTSIRSSNLHGPTRDPVDVVLRDVSLPSLTVGDWLMFANMGAYTRSLATRHSGPNQHELIYFFRTSDDSGVLFNLFS